MPNYGNYNVLSMQAANALVRLHFGTGSSEPALLACMISDKFPVMINQNRIYQ